MKHIHLDNLPHLDFLFERVSAIQPYFDEQIDAAFRRGEINPNVKRELIAFLVEMISSRLQEAFYSEFLGMDLGLVGADEEQARLTITEVVETSLQGVLQSPSLKIDATKSFDSFVDGQGGS